MRDDVRPTEDDVAEARHDLIGAWVDADADRLEVAARLLAMERARTREARAEVERQRAFNEENIRYWQGVRDSMMANNDTLRARVAEWQHIAADRQNPIDLTPAALATYIDELEATDAEHVGKWVEARAHAATLEGQVARLRGDAVRFDGKTWGCVLCEAGRTRGPDDVPHEADCPTALPTLPFVEAVGRLKRAARDTKHLHSIGCPQSPMSDSDMWGEPCACEQAVLQAAIAAPALAFLEDK